MHQYDVFVLWNGPVQDFNEISEKDVKNYKYELGRDDWKIYHAIVR